MRAREPVGASFEASSETLEANRFRRYFLRAGGPTCRTALIGFLRIRERGPARVHRAIDGKTARRIHCHRERPQAYTLSTFATTARRLWGGSSPAPSRIETRRHGDVFKDDLSSQTAKPRAVTRISPQNPPNHAFRHWIPCCWGDLEVSERVDFPAFSRIVASITVRRG